MRTTISPDAAAIPMFMAVGTMNPGLSSRWMRGSRAVLPDDVARLIGGHPVHDEYLHPVGRIVLPHEAPSVREAAPLAANGQDDAHGRQLGGSPREALTARIRAT
jgi:hypothetical protein